MLITRFFKEENYAYPIVDDEEIDKQMFSFLDIWRKRDPNYIHLLAFDGKKPIGYIFGTIYERDYGLPRRVACCRELYVIPEKRVGKVAYKLVQESMKIAMQQKVEGFECIGSDSTDKGGTINRWERFGFKKYDAWGSMSLADARRIISGRSKEELRAAAPYNGVTVHVEDQGEETDETIH